MQHYARSSAAISSFLCSKPVPSPSPVKMPVSYTHLDVYKRQVTTWALMTLLVIGARLITRRLKTDNKISRWQCILEMLVTTMQQEIKNVGLDQPEQYIGFIGTLFLFIAAANICIIFPFYVAPTGSLSTTAALAICVFLAVPFFGISKTGFTGYLKTYILSLIHI